MIFARLYRPDLIAGDDRPCGFAILCAGADVSNLPYLHTLATEATTRHAHATAYQLMVGHTFTGARPFSLRHNVR